MASTKRVMIIIIKQKMCDKKAAAAMIEELWGREERVVVPGIDLVSGEIDR